MKLQCDLEWLSACLVRLSGQFAFKSRMKWTFSPISQAETLHSCGFPDRNGWKAAPDKRKAALAV
jgi:hypothetical protein